MRKVLFIAGLIGIISCGKKGDISQVVEVSCGQCNFEMKPKGCDLAVRIDQSTYFVDGFNIDDFGNAHDEKTGFCEVVRKAKVKGELVNNRFEMSSIEFMEPDSAVTR